MGKRNGEAESGQRNGFRLRYGQREIPLSAPVFVLGRSSKCNLTLPGGLVSRQHAQLSLHPEGLHIEDLGSRNGVRVNGTVVEERTPLNHGDVIEIGLQQLEVLEEALLHRHEHLSTLPPTHNGLNHGDDMTAITRLEVLSKRELEVFELIVQGHTHRQIAEKLHLSVKTIETHRTHIGEKLGCRTRNELVRYAILAGVLRIDHPSLR